MAIASMLLALVLVQAPSADAPERSKKQAFVEDKANAANAADAGVPARVGQLAQRPIWANNLRTHEIRALTGAGGIPEGEAGARARGEFFRCWFTLKQGPIASELLAGVIAAAEHFGAREIDIISGFRHPKYNLMLRKKGREVATKSQHTQAKAIDFFLPGIATRELYDWLLINHSGGVGFYPVSEFVHVDLGRKRTWQGV